jgi:hypothetical protein
VLQSSDVDFDEVADELYGLSPEDFTAARNANAKQARADKDRALADRITALRKPTTAAWATNQLVRVHGDEVNLLLDLGRELREVMADIEGDDLRKLTKQRYQLVSALVQQARSLAQSRGRRLTDDAAQAVRTTLEATLSDESSAEAVAAGRLTDGLEVSGFSTAGFSGPGPGTRGQGEGRPAVPRSTTSTDNPVADLDAERQRRAVDQAERDVAAAEKAAQRARIAGERARQRLQTAERDRQEAADAVDRAQRLLDEATADLEARERKEQEAGKESDDARRRCDEADEELTRARAELEDLRG